MRNTTATLAALLLGNAGLLASQSLATPFPTWRAELMAEVDVPVGPVADLLPEVGSGSGRHNHALTGLLIGSAVGLAATGVFLAGFCSGDSQCGADEYGRAAIIIALPAALVGTVIGALVHTGG